MPDARRPKENLRALIAGASGFIGRHLVSRLLMEKARVAVLIRRPGFDDVPVEEIVVPEWSGESLAAALQGRSFDWVFNLAAGGVHPAMREREELYRLNVECALALTEFSVASKVRSHVHVGSCAEYGLDFPGPLSEEAPLERNKVYGLTKSLGTQASLAAAASGKLPFVAARLFGVFGPGEGPHRLLPTLVAKLSQRQHALLTQGDQVRDMMHVDDAVSGLIALALAAEDRGTPDLVNLCTGEGVTVRRFSEKVAQILKADPKLLRFGAQPYRTDDVMHLVGDTTRLRSVTGWQPRLGLDAGLVKAIVRMQSTSFSVR